MDTPGFQNPATAASSDGLGATFQDLCHNYVQERLQLLFHDTHFTAQLNRYAQERIEITLDGELNEESSSPEPLVDMLDRSPQSAVARASTTNLRDIDRRGFLWLLDDEALVSQSSSEEELLDKFSAMYQDRCFEKLYTRGEKNQLVIHHNQGTNSVAYNLEGWLKAARENPTTRNAAIALTESNKYAPPLCPPFLPNSQKKIILLKSAPLGRIWRRSSDPVAALCLLPCPAQWPASKGANRCGGRPAFDEPSHRERPASNANHWLSSSSSKL